MIGTRKQIGRFWSGPGRAGTVVAALLLAPLGIFLGCASSASAAAATGEYAVFTDCPLGNPEVNQCIYAQTTSGEFKIGNETVPITKTITLQGGLIANEETETETFVDAENGETLSKTPQSVPGGLAGLVDCPEIAEPIEKALCKLAFENGVTGATATAELAGPIGINEGNLILGEGVALTLPLKVHLSNPLLGDECYIGSDSKPVTLHLTTGTTSPPPPNEPITGSVGELKFKEEGRILVISKNSLVDNSYSAPGVTGCGGVLSILLDPIIDAKLGLPAAAGDNTAILNGSLEQAAAKAVRNSES